jgi:CBS domain-containing protein
MSHRKVREVMTASVVTARVDTPFKELAVLMAEQGVSALPVLDAEGHLAGIVSEADLLPKQEAQEDPNARPLPWWRRWLARGQAAGTSAAGVMTSPAVTIGLDDSVVAAARLMERHRIKRLAVTSPDGRLAGIVSRADLVRVFCRPDPEIREEIVREVFTDFLGTNPALVRVTVTEGMVTLAGEVEKKSMIPFALRMARSVDGVVDVTSELTFAVDDTRLPPVPDLTNY